MPALDGRSVAIVVTEYGVEEAELADPRNAVLDAGGRAAILATGDGPVRTLVHDKSPGDTFAVDAIVDSANADDYDAVLIPGGTINADTLRTHPEAVAFVKAFVDAAKPVGAICHGPWALVEAGVVTGKTLTSYPSLRTDVTNAGGTWVDQDVKVCKANGWTLVTSRNPGDLPAFCDAVVDEFAAS